MVAIEEDERKKKTFRDSSNMAPKPNWNMKEDKQEKDIFLDKVYKKVKLCIVLIKMTISTFKEKYEFLICYTSGG